MKKIAAYGAALFFAAYSPASFAEIDKDTALAKGCAYLREAYPTMPDCHDIRAQLQVDPDEPGGRIWIIDWGSNPTVPPATYAIPGFYVILSITDGHQIQIGGIQR